MVKVNNIGLRYIVITEQPGSEVISTWNDLLDNCSHATHFTTPDFFVDPSVRVGERFAVLALNGHRIEGIVTGLRNGRQIRCGLPDRPQTAFRDGVDLLALYAPLCQGIDEFGGDEVELVDIYSWVQIGEIGSTGFVESRCGNGDRVVMLDLTKGPETLFRDFSERRRTQLRKAQKAGKIVVKRVETEAELGELYKIHTVWNETKGITPDTYENFRKVLGSKYRMILIAFFEGKIIAGTYMRYCENGIVEYAANNSLVEFWNLQANKLLGWRAIEWACENGFGKFSLGASHPFLNRFGREIVAAFRYRSDRSFLRHHSNRERFNAMARNVYPSLTAFLKSKLNASGWSGL